VVILDKSIVIDVQKYKTVTINKVVFEDNLRVVTNKGFLVEILRPKESQEFMYRLVLVNVLREGVKPLTGFGDNYSVFFKFLEKLIS
jgi:hypothetical protein